MSFIDFSDSFNPAIYNFNNTCLKFEPSVTFSVCREMFLKYIVKMLLTQRQQTSS